MGNIPANSFIIRCYIHVIQAFNGVVTTLEIGTDADSNRFTLAESVMSTGIKNPSSGTGMGYNIEQNNITTYLNDIGNPSQGKALVVLEYMPVSESP
jgi:hypothetical protein